MGRPDCPDKKAANKPVRKPVRKPTGGNGGGRTGGGGKSGGNGGCCCQPCGKAQTESCNLPVQELAQTDFLDNALY